MITGDVLSADSGNHSGISAAKAMIAVSQGYFCVGNSSQQLRLSLDSRKNPCLTLYLNPSSGTMSTSKMYFAHGIRPERFTLQCGNILLENIEGYT